MPSIGARLVAEFGGAAFLLAIVVGSGIMAQRLSAGNAGVALLANSVATGAGLYALIAAMLPTSVHFNPAVTALALWRRLLSWPLASAYVVAQFSGAATGVVAAHAMFGEPLWQSGGADRTGWGLVFAEFVATLGLLGVVSLARRRNIAAAVAAYITAAYWFTASTSFANPAVTVARALTHTMTGIGWSAVPGFIGGQLAAVLVVGAAFSIARRKAANTEHRL